METELSIDAEKGLRPLIWPNGAKTGINLYKKNIKDLELQKIVFLMAIKY